MKDWTSCPLGACVLSFALVASVSPAWAGFPTLTRAFDTEDYLISHDQLVARRQCAVAGSMGLAARVRSDGCSGLRPIEFVTRGDGDKSWGRLNVGAGAAWDGSSDLDPAEFPLQLSAGVHMPEVSSSLQGSVGGDGSGYRGVDVVLETHLARLCTPFDTADLRTALFGWLRARSLHGQDKPVVDPALGLVLPHVPALANRLALALSAQSELQTGQLPHAFAMLQLRYLGTARSLGGAAGRDRLPGGRLTHKPDRRTTRWFGFGAWAVPLDTRIQARLTAQVGLRFLAP